MIKKPRIKLVYPLTALLLFASISTLKNISAGSGNELIVYNTPGYATIGLKSGKNLMVYSDNPVIPNEVKRHCSVLGLKTDLRLLSDSILSIRAGDKSILICNQPERGWKMAEKADIIIVTGKRSFTRSDLPFTTSFQKQEVILAVSGTNIIRVANRATYSNNRIRSVKESGAIREQL